MPPKKSSAATPGTHTRSKSRDVAGERQGVPKSAASEKRRKTQGDAISRNAIPKPNGTHTNGENGVVWMTLYLFQIYP